MKIPPRLIELRKYHDAIIAALGSSTVPVYFDTSMLMWLLKVGGQARQEFLAWCRSALGARAHVPTWAAHEFYRHLREETALLQLRGQSAEYQKTLSALLLDVSLRADDFFCGPTVYRDRAEFVQATRDAVRALQTQLGALAKSDDWYTKAVDSVTAFVNERITETNAFDLLAAIQATYEARFNGRVPPGYADDVKKNNSLGDLVFWQEIIADLSTRSGSTGVLILSNDNKPDWHHKPKQVLNYDGTEIGTQPSVGVELKVPHPLLQHEAACRIGIDDVFIVNASILAVVLDRTISDQVRAFVAATHPKLIRKDEEGINWGKIAPKPKIGTGPTLAPGEQATRTSTAVVSESPVEAPEKVNLDDVSPTAFEDLHAYVPLQQKLHSLTTGLPDRTKATDDLSDPVWLSACSLLDGVIVGRALYRSASKNGEPAISAIADILSNEQMPLQTANGLLLGAFVELYFEDGLVLRSTPMAGPFEFLFDMQANPRFAPAINKIESLLTPHSDNLLLLPSTNPPLVEILLELDRPLEGKVKELRSVVVHGKELLCDVKQGSPSSLSAIFQPPPATVSQVCRIVSDRFFIPIRQLKTELQPSALVSWSDDTGLCHLRTDLGGVADELAVMFHKEK